jgi:septin family protein
VVNREIKRGFTFNILVMGETGVGKSTLMDSLFKRPLEDVTHTHDAKSVGCQVFTHDLEEGGVKLKLTIVHSTGFGDQLDRQQSPESLVGYIQTQFERYLQEELKTSRNLWRLHDSRIHACLYLLQPNGHSLKSLDLVTMRAIHDKVRSACDVLARPVVHNEGVVVILPSHRR